MFFRFVLILSLFLYPSLAYAKSQYQDAPYRTLLKKYVSFQGQVNYKDMKKSQGSLARYLVYVDRVNAKEYQAWPKSGKIAFWINTYNALTLKAIVENYPISSIRKISGVWNRKKFKVMGKQMTLDHIEHSILRKKFNEPRIHMALVCASKGCPDLRNEPFTASGLNNQLNQQTQKFIKDRSKFKIEKNTVYLSSIFKWYGKDFVPFYKTKGYAGSISDKASLKFIAQYLTASQKKLLKAGKYRVKYLSYDWTLNGF